MAILATFPATGNWSADASWTYTGMGTMSGADGVLASGVLTPTVSPAWTVGALVGRRMKLDATWYSVSANTATTATITSPPADATYAYLVGGAPLAGDDQTIATGQTVTFDVTRAPATSGILGDLTFQTTGKMTATIAVNRELHVKNIVCGSAGGSIGTTGATSGKYFDIHATSVTGGTGDSAFAIFPQHSNSVLQLHTTTVTGGSHTNAPAIVSNFGPMTIDGDVEGVTGRVTVIGGVGLGIWTYNNAGTAVTVTGGDIRGSATTAAAGIGSSSLVSVPAGVICVDCDFYDSATATAVSGRPCVRQITDRANFDSHVTVNLNGAGNATVRFVVLPALGTVAKDVVLCSGGASYIGTRTDAAVGDVKAGVKYGDPDDQLTGELVAGGGVRRGGALRGA